MAGKKLKFSQGWEIRLSQFLRDRAGQPFAWGSNDCAMFPADAVLAMSGCDPAHKQREQYSDAAGAQELLEAAGGLAGLFTACLRFAPHQNYRMARRGDIVIMLLDGRQTGGVVDDTAHRIAAVSLDRGLVRLPLKKASHIWSF